MPFISIRNSIKSSGNIIIGCCVARQQNHRDATALSEHVTIEMDEMDCTGYRIRVALWLNVRWQKQKRKHIFFLIVGSLKAGTLSKSAMKMLHYGNFRIHSQPYTQQLASEQLP